LKPVNIYCLVWFWLKKTVVLVWFSFLHMQFCSVWLSGEKKSGFLKTGASSGFLRVSRVALLSASRHVVKMSSGAAQQALGGKSALMS